jgi:hypothetical protein
LARWAFVFIRGKRKRGYVMYWHESAKKLHSKLGNQWQKIADALSKEYNEDFKPEKVRVYFRFGNVDKVEKKDELTSDALLTALQKECTVDDLCERFGTKHI